jgi:ribosomal protein S18 acetylase RimI-like enzyme
MPLKEIDFGTKEYEQMLELRYEVLRKPLGLSFTDNEMERSKSDILVGCFDDDELQGCCMITDKGDGVAKLRQMAVRKSYQGTGIGRELLLYCETIARAKGFKKMIMHARTSAIGFYEKLGYNIVGEEFTEVTIPHYVMEKELIS